MPDLVILDTDILIDTARGIDEASACLQTIEERSTAAISIVTQMELMIGCRNKNELEALEHFFERFVVIRIDGADIR